MNFGIASDHIGVCPQCQNAESEANKMGKNYHILKVNWETGSGILASIEKNWMNIKNCWMRDYGILTFIEKN